MTFDQTITLDRFIEARRSDDRRRQILGIALATVAMASIVFSTWRLISGDDANVAFLLLIQAIGVIMPIMIWRSATRRRAQMSLRARDTKTWLVSMRADLSQTARERLLTMAVAGLIATPALLIAIWQVVAAGKAEVAHGYWMAVFTVIATAVVLAFNYVGWKRIRGQIEGIDEIE